MNRVAALAPVPLLAGTLMLFPNVAHAQECPERREKGPDIPSVVRALEGRLVYHNGIRQWFELKLDRPQCKQASIQLAPVKDDWKAMEVLRGCRVKSVGHIDFSGTGYFSLDAYQSVEQIEAIGACARQLPLPDYSKAKPDASVRQYRVEMRVNYRHGDHPIIFRVTSSGRRLSPWQAYASYDLTGGFVLYGHCGEGFVADSAFGTPQANPWYFDDTAVFDPESAAESGKWDLHLGYTCARPRKG